MPITAGVAAPEFSLPDQSNQLRSLSEWRGQWLLLYFYPKDDTPGCTTEACTIRDSWSKFEEAGITVVGVSADSPASHAEFAEKYHLPFTLLSDQDKTVITAYDALKDKSMFGKSFLGVARCSFLIDPQGKIVKVYPDVVPDDHAGEVLADAKTFTHA